MRILILSYFYSPDLSAGSFRTSALVDGLRELKIPELDIEIICTQPNRYESKARDVLAFEEQAHLKIFRVQGVKSYSGIISNLLAFTKYAKAVIRITKSEKYDLIYATSSKLFTASLAAYIANKNNMPLYLDIRDIFSDTFKDIKFYRVNFLINPIISYLENWTINKASYINLVSPGFKNYFNPRYPNKIYSYFTNGIDEDFLNINNVKKQKNAKSNIRILYAGNIGEGQGLEKIIPVLALKLNKSYEFRVIGDGGARKILEDSLRTYKVNNVEIISPQNRHDLISEYENADILFLHLNSYLAFKLVLPSKLFEYAASGKPILAGVEGYSKKFILENIINAQIFKPCDHNSAIEALGRLSLNYASRDDFIKTYRRKTIMEKFAKTLIQAGQEKNNIEID
jgi:hypothetical protein